MTEIKQIIDKIWLAEDERFNQDHIRERLTKTHTVIKDNYVTKECYNRLGTALVEDRNKREQYVIKARNETINECIELIDNGVFIDIEDWQKTKKHLTKVMGEKLIAELKKSLKEA